MYVTDDLLSPKRNNLTLARLILATSVIYSHAFVGFGRKDDAVWLLGSEIANFAVDGFFALSGFLVYRSLCRKRSIRAFALARAVRLWPALVVMIAVTVLAGALVTTAPFPQYITGTDTLKYIVNNLTFLGGRYTLTGIECGAGPCNINGSLWTLPWEARCYVALVALAVFGLVNRRAMLRIVLPASFVFAVAMDIPAVQSLFSPGALFNLMSIDRLWTAFAIGILAYELRGRIPLAWRNLAGLVALDILIWHVFPVAGQHMQAILAAYFALCLGFLSARKRAVSADWPDYSYGIYIYAFPVMTALLLAGQWKSPYLLAPVVFVVTLPFAAASWHFVEKPALDWLRGDYPQRLDVPATIRL